MALVFSVSAPKAKFCEPFASTLGETFRVQFGDSIDCETDIERYSDELGWSGWRTLQERGAEACGADKIPHFLSMDAWHGCYLPLSIDVGSFEFSDDSPNLDIGSLDALISELELVGNALGLPLDDKSLDALFRKYIDDDDLVDDDMDVQTFTQLLPLARFARKNNLPLWIIK